MAESIQLVLKNAIATGDMNHAISEHASSLTVHDTEVLKAISPADLTTLKRLEELARQKKGMTPISAIKPKDIVSSVWIGGIW